jgi:hypothetical protein
MLPLVVLAKFTASFADLLRSESSGPFYSDGERKKERKKEEGRQSPVHAMMDALLGWPSTSSRNSLR